jgi:hypothetical protein
MEAVLNRLRKLADDELLAVSEAIDRELDRRLQLSDLHPESARQRAVQRAKSYRHCNGASALPVRITGMRPTRRRRLAA